MKRFLEIFKGARRLELILLAAAVAILLLQLGGQGLMGGGEVQTDLEKRLSGLLSQMDGVGRVRVMVAQRKDGEIDGVVVAAQGADDLGVCLRVQYAVQTLLGVESAKIEIVRLAG